MNQSTTRTTTTTANLVAIPVDVMEEIVIRCQVTNTTKPCGEAEEGLSNSCIPHLIERVVRSGCVGCAELLKLKRMLCFDLREELKYCTYCH